jgi:hypothetical protein
VLSQQQLASDGCADSEMNAWRNWLDMLAYRWYRDTHPIALISRVGGCPYGGKKAICPIKYGRAWRHLRHSGQSMYMCTIGFQAIKVSRPTVKKHLYKDNPDNQIQETTNLFMRRLWQVLTYGFSYSMHVIDLLIIWTTAECSLVTAQSVLVPFVCRTVQYRACVQRLHCMGERGQSLLDGPCRDRAQSASIV